MRWFHIYTRVMRVPHFYYRRVMLGLVNLLVGPPGWAPQEMLRAGLLRLIGCRVGSHCQISEHFYIYQGYNLSLGDGGRIGSFARIWDFCPIRIGRNLLASHNLTMISATHELNEERTNRPGPIVLGDNVWIGINVTIVGPVVIGDDVIIGANSVVLSDLASGGIYGGVPARLIRLIKQSPGKPA